MIKLDSTQISTVVKCTLCPWWSAFAFSRSEGWTRGAAHEQRAHPNQSQARQALLMTRRRAT